MSSESEVNVSNTRREGKRGVIEGSRRAVTVTTFTENVTVYVLILEKKNNPTKLFTWIM